MKVSILTPSFNQAAFLRQAIDSVQSQRGPFELEHIVVDGGSTDGSVEILRGYGPSVRYVSEKDEGQADALNKGMRMCSGDVIGWLNSDDLYYPGALAAMAEVFQREPQTQWLYGKVRIVDRRGRQIRRAITFYKNLHMARYSYARLLRENWISQMGVFWRRQAALAVGNFNKDLHYCMDYEYWLRLGRLAPGRFLNQYLGAFRWYPISKSGGGFVRQFRQELEVARHMAAGRYPLSMLAHQINCWKIIIIYSIMRAMGL